MPGKNRGAPEIRLRRDAALLTAATGAIAARRLDVPLDGGARVRELGESLAAMEQLRQALELARAHQERRIEKGAVIIERPDITINLEGAGESITVSLDEDPLAPKAHLLVSELMVLTNAALAAWAKEHGVTLLHRTQDVAIPKEFSAWSKRWTPPCWKPIHARTPALGKRCMRRPRLRCAAIPI